MTDFGGWPTALHLSSKGHDVAIVDNLSRRKIEHELSSYSLTHIAPIKTRLNCWLQETGKKIDFHYLDISSDYNKLLQQIINFKPDTIVHFAEQRSAPYSMLSSEAKQ